MPIASAPYALPWATSLRSRLVPSCAAEILTQPRASRTVTARGFSFFSTPLARATSRILRATSRVSSAMDGFLCDGGGSWVGSRTVEAHRQHAGDVKGATPGAVLDLMPARGSVSDDQRRIVRAPHGRQQRQFGHLHRGLIGVGAVAEGAGHAATARLDGFDIQIRNQPKHLLDRFERAERFLMAVAVHQCLPGDRSERQLQTAGLGLTNQKLLEQQRVRADAFRCRVGTQRQKLVAKRQQTARLQTDDWHATRGERRVSSDQPVELSACVINQARRKKRPSAAQRPATIRGLWNVDTVSALDQHAY